MTTASLSSDQRKKAYEEMMLILGPILASFNQSGNKNQTGTSTSKSITRLTKATASALLKTITDAEGYSVAFTDADISKFITNFHAAQDEQIQTIIDKTKDKVTPGATADAVSTVVSETIRTEYPSFFDPANFAKDYVWSKINFGDSKTLGPKAVTILANAKALAAKFHITSISDKEIETVAKNIAMGKMTLDDFNIQLQTKAAIEYPNLAARFKENPSLTTYDVASPIISMLEKTWEMPKGSIDMNQSIVLEWLRPGGADGKSTSLTYAELLRKAKNDPKWQMTTEANELARDSAVSWGRAMGGGI